MAETPAGMVHADSIDSQDPNNTPQTKTKSRRPANTAFRQQRLKAWQPILTPKTVLPLFFAIGIIFAPIGGGLLYASAVVQEIILDYTHCYDQAPIGTPGTMPPNLVTSHFTKNSQESYVPSAPTWSRQDANQEWDGGVVVPTIQCNITFSIPNTMKAPVLFYYRLTNFYQNHRRYAKSFNTDQLSGTAVSADSVAGSDCSPLTTVTGEDGKKRPYYPCGLAPNSVFNDTFSSPLLLNKPDSTNSTSSSQVYNMSSSNGISWASDKVLYGESKYNWADVAVPPNWVLRYPNGYSDAHHPHLADDEAFQVWMRLAGLPTFSKLAQRNDNQDMVAGTYTVSIYHNFNVTEYGGTKAIIISTRTIMGGKNPFLGIAYIVVGGICILLGALFTVTHLIRPRKLGDHTYLSWNNEGANAGGGGSVVASGRDGNMGVGGEGMGSRA